MYEAVSSYFLLLIINGLFFAYILMHIVKNKLRTLPELLAKIKDVIDKLKKKDEVSEIWSIKDEEEDDPKKKKDKSEESINNLDELDEEYYAVLK